ncbi:MAG: hypothetical protein ACREQY_06660 [Candidatus Binatia bacterium]
MPKYHYVVLTSALPGRLEEFERWYDNQHIPDVLKVPGVNGVRRYRLLNAVTDTVEDPPWSSLAVYEFEGDDPLAIARRLTEMAGSKAMPITDTIGPVRSKIIAELVAEHPAEDSGSTGRSSSTADDSRSVDLSSPELRALSGLDQLRALFPSATPPLRQWMGDTLGFDYVEIDEGRIVVGATPHERFYNPLERSS